MIRRALLALDFRAAIHLALSLIMIWLAVDFILPGDELAKPTFRAFRLLGDETEWAFAFLATGFVGVVGLVASQGWVRRLSLFTLSSAHTLIAGLFWLGITHDYGIPSSAGTYSIIAALGYILLLNRVAE